MRISDWSSDVCSSDLERRLGGIDIEARTQSEVVGSSRIVGDTFSARRGVGRHEDQAKLRARPAILPLFGDVGVRAGQTRKIPDDGQAGSGRMTRYEDGECHLRPRAGGGMLVDTLDPGMAIGSADLRSEEHTSELQSLMRI